MKSSIFFPLSSKPRRSLRFEAALAATFLFLWFLSDCIQVRIAISRTSLDLSVDILRWRTRWLLLPWLIGAGGFLLLYLRLRFHVLSREGAIRRLRGLSLFTSALLLARLAALWHPLTLLFPFLGLLWSPHATWALCLLYLGHLHLFLPQREVSSTRRISDRSIAAGLFALGLVVYVPYALYSCQLTMPHGDEGQYLWVTYSLLHDGDFDLSDDLSLEQILEFHVLSTEVHRAPGAPPGKVYCLHPIGLSAALVPAYWAGLELWKNPRLGAVLFVVLLAAACLPLAFTWLVRLGVGRPQALAGVLVMGSTAPFFYYTNQLYPDLPALFVEFCLLAALAHWQVPGGYRSWGRLEPVFLILLTLLTSCLPFLHPRFAPIAALGGLLLLAQAWRSQQRAVCLIGFGLVVAAGLYALLRFNFAFSGDWMGPFRPGNAWGKGALDPAVWKLSLAGHWIQARKGILNCSPIFLFALAGWIGLVVRGDRRLWSIGILYLATAAINGLHPEWEFGFCHPARFLLTAMPVLLYGLAAALRAAARSRTGLFLALLAFCLSLGSIVQTLQMPEGGYDGRNLMQRSINAFYPWQVHFWPAGQSGLPFLDLSFWLLLLAALTVLLSFSRSLPLRIKCIVLVSAALLPFLWGRTSTLSGRLRRSVSPYAAHLVAGRPEPRPRLLQYPVRTRHLETGTQGPDGRYLAQAPEHRPGFVAVGYVPPLTPGQHLLELLDPDFSAPPGKIAGHLILFERLSVPQVSPWGIRFSRPMKGSTNPASMYLRLFSNRPSPGYAYVEFSGTGKLSFRGYRLTSLPVPISFRSWKIQQRHLGRAGQPNDEGRIVLATFFPGLEEGYYRVHFSMDGFPFSTLFQRRPVSLVTAVYAGPVARTQQEREILKRRAVEWMQEYREQLLAKTDSSYVRPLVESAQPPWWLTLPFVGEDFYDLRFHLDEPSDVWVLFQYAGEAKLEVEKATLYGELPVEAGP